MILMPCNTCRLKATCELRADKRRLLRGAKLTSARFDCQLQRDDMPPGAVVDAKLKYVYRGDPGYIDEDGAQEGPDISPGILRGIVMRWYQGKVLVYFPEQDEGSLWSWAAKGDRNAGPVEMAKLSPACLTPTGEREIVCRHCGLPKSAADSDRRLKWTCGLRGEGDDDCEYGPEPEPAVLPW